MNQKTKTILKHVAFILCVPTVIVVGVYGAKAFKYYKKKKQENKEDKEEGKEETKVIPISKDVELKIKKEKWIVNE